MSYDYQLVIIGSGSGGKDAAILGARAELRVLLVEKDSLGGTCFHRGVYAMRALRACAMNLKSGRDSLRSRLSVGPLEYDWADWVQTQRRVRARLTEDLIRMLESLGVKIRFGKGNCWRHRHGVDPVRMAFEWADRLAALQIPEPQRSVARARDGTAAVRRHRHGFDQVRMASFGLGKGGCY